MSGQMEITITVRVEDGTSDDTLDKLADEVDKFFENNKQMIYDRYPFITNLECDIT